MKHTYKVQSSTVIVEINYNNNILAITFLSGSIYVYSGVTEGVFECFVVADSKGQYFRENIMGRYPSLRVL